MPHEDESGIDAAQGIVGAQFDNDGIGTLGQRPVQARETAGRGIAGNPGVDHQGIDVGRASSLAWSCATNPSSWGKAVTSGQAVAQGDNTDRIMPPGA